ncbi:MAG: hypothetical protein OEZ68_18630 [Gammaproteobacteria bacterium]|nr:hypothetical protein [Gammaproteobacteria bacterium]MDH5802823.1 hypothetical protein [Gammaproteobacteria bacterium]
MFITRNNRCLASLVLISVIMATACTQKQVRHSNLQVTDMVTDGTPVQKDQPMLVGAVKISNQNLHIDEATHYMNVIQATLRQHGLIADIDTRSPGEAGVTLTANLEDSIQNDGLLSDLLRKDFNERNPASRGLLVVVVEGVSDQTAKDSDNYQRLQSVRVVYRLWSLTSGKMTHKLAVEGYFLSKNERFVADQGSTVSKESANALYRLLHESTPEQVPMVKILMQATRTFLEKLAVPKSPERAK